MVKLLIEFPDPNYPRDMEERAQLLNDIADVIPAVRDNMSIREWHDNMDITGSNGVSIQVSNSGEVIWINTDEQGCVLRICRIKKLIVDDQRNHRTPLAKVLHILKETRGLSADAVVRLERITKKDYEEW